ncbi:MAG TPA: 2-nitropropane dioxygenase [Elusimicrobia bacterium]|nr:2-nitropropane dioxygenase [Elusimicrobiota bacterium]
MPHAELDKTTPDIRPDPVIISGGMGVHISCWQMARIVSMMGALGVVSGTALEIVYPRILQNGDPGGHIRRAFDELTRRQPALGEPLSRLIEKYYIKDGKAADKPFKSVPFAKLSRIEGHTGPDSFWESSRELQVLTIAANFAEVWLAKEGHEGFVGINFLRKVERPLPWALYGAILAGVDYVLVGAGSPPEIPGMMESLSAHQPASLPLKVHGTRSDRGEFFVTVRPETLGCCGAGVKQPRFLAIVSSFGLAKALASDPKSRPYGFVVEGPQAGGHNAPPARMRFDERGQQIVEYTTQDSADIEAIAGLGLPFWLAGSYASPERLREALGKGATGVQIGTAAALSGQSGMEPELRRRALQMALRNELVVTDTMVSPTGFPFKVAHIPGTISDNAVYLGRKRVCDICLLQTNYITPDGSLGYRCPAEPVSDFTAKGGREQNTVGRACLCNGLLSATGLAQIRADGYVEPPIVTLGDDFQTARELFSLLPPGQETYSIGKLILLLRRGA